MCLPPKAGADAPNAPTPKLPNAGALPAPKAGAEACWPKAGVDDAPNTGVLPAPKAGVLAAPNAGVLDAPKASEPDWVAPNAGTLAAGAPKAGALAGAPNALLAPAPNKPDCCAAADDAPAPKASAGALASAAPKAGVLWAPNAGALPAPKLMVPPMSDLDAAGAAAVAAPKVKEEAAAEEDCGSRKDGAGKPVVDGSSGAGPVSRATKGLAAPAEPADGDTDMLLSRLLPLPCPRASTITQHAVCDTSKITSKM